MSEQHPLHPSIVALVSLASNIASNHPKQGLCQLDRLRSMGVPDHQIAAVVEIARHIRDEAGQMLDFKFDEQAGLEIPAMEESTPTAAPPAEGEACCTPTASGQSCC